MVLVSAHLPSLSLHFIPTSSSSTRPADSLCSLLCPFLGLGSFHGCGRHGGGGRASSVGGHRLLQSVSPLPLYPSGWFWLLFPPPLPSSLSLFPLLVSPNLKEGEKLAGRAGMLRLCRPDEPIDKGLWLYARGPFGNKVSKRCTSSMEGKGSHRPNHRGVISSAKRPLDVRK